MNMTNERQLAKQQAVRNIAAQTQSVVDKIEKKVANTPQPMDCENDILQFNNFERLYAKHHGKSCDWKHNSPFRQDADTWRAGDVASATTTTTLSSNPLFSDRGDQAAICEYQESQQENTVS